MDRLPISELYNSELPLHAAFYYSIRDNRQFRSEAFLASANETLGIPRLSGRGWDDEKWVETGVLQNLAIRSNEIKEEAQYACGQVASNIMLALQIQFPSSNAMCHELG